MTDVKSLAEILLEYALSLGAAKINALPGLWIHQIDEHWLVKCNGHRETMEGVPPYSWSFEYNGWPAGIRGVRGDGIICAGEAANEKTLKAAIEVKMKKGGEDTILSSNN